MNVRAAGYCIVRGSFLVCGPELYESNCSPRVISRIKSKVLRRAEHVARIEQKRNAK
jgi:hypothetical protein